MTPKAANAARLAAIAHAAFDGQGTPWRAEDFIALGAPPHAAMIVDGAFRDALLILQFAADEAEILDFGVVPAARGRGLGRALLAAGEDLARALGMAAMFLEVAVDNRPARRLYQRAGWREVGRRRGYYARPAGSVDALILRRSLA